MTTATAFVAADTRVALAAVAVALLGSGCTASQALVALAAAFAAHTDQPVVVPA